MAFADAGMFAGYEFWARSWALDEEYKSKSHIVRRPSKSNGSVKARPKTYCGGGACDGHESLEAWAVQNRSQDTVAGNSRQGTLQATGGLVGEDAGTWSSPVGPIARVGSGDVNGSRAKDLVEAPAKTLKKWHSRTNLRRNKAFYRPKTADEQRLHQATRSKSLTHIECLEASAEDLGATTSASAAASVATSPRDRDRNRDVMGSETPDTNFPGRHLSFHHHHPHPHHPPLQQHPSLPPLPLPLSPPLLFGDKLAVPSLDDKDKKSNKSHKCPQKILSQEFFSVSFDVIEEPTEEIFPIIRGHTLRDALQHLFDKRCLDFQSHVLVLEPHGSALSPQHELGRLGGCHIRVKAREALGANGTQRVGKSISASRDIQRKTSGSTRSKKSSGLLGLSVEDGHNGQLDSTNPSSLQGSQEGSWKMGKTRSQGRLSNLFSTSFKDKEKMEALADLLNSYSQHGIPELPGLLTFGHEDEDDQLLRLEDTWTQIVEDAMSLPERSQRQQSAIWELLTTEVAYIRKLRVITDLFLMCLCNLQSQRLLNEIDTEKLFNNIRDIYYSNRLFWKECLLRMLNESRATRKPLNPILMKDSFLNFDQAFQPYTKFCLEQANCLQYLKEKHQENELFKAYIAWCETRKECNRLRLLDLLVKPMQRLTKYPLVLKGIHRTTDNEEDRQVLLEMWKHADRFVLKVNSVVGQSQEQKQMAAISARIDSYEAVDTKDDEVEKVLRQHMELNLECPMPGCNPQQSRHLFLEGDVKLKDSGTSKMDVRCFLFTDMLLVCKPTTKKSSERVKVVRQPYVIDRIIVHELRDTCSLALIYLNEYHVATAVFTLHCHDTKQARNWSDTIRKAKDMYKDAKMASAERPESVGFLTVEGEDDLDSPSTALLVARSPRGSSVPSLVHSHSGSVDMSDPTSGTVSQGRAVSLELSDLRASSASSDEGSATELQRARSLGAEPKGHHDQSNNPTSPRPERRAFFLRGGSGGSSPSTLSVSYPYAPAPTPAPSEPFLTDICCGSTTDLDQQVPPPLTEPPAVMVTSPKALLSPTSRSVTHPPLSPRVLQRGSQVQSLPGPPTCAPPTPKPRLVNTKNLAKNETPTTTFDFDIPVITGVSERWSPESDDEKNRGKDEPVKGPIALPRTNKRPLRNDRRYHTADSIENMKRGERRDTTIHKRLSWHYGQQGSSCCQGHQHDNLQQQQLQQVAGLRSDNFRSTDSMYSSSGVSSTGSLQLELNDEDCQLALDQRQRRQCWTEGMGQCPLSSTSLVEPEVTIDVSEVKDGISSVQINIAEGSRAQPTKADLLRMRELVLNDHSLEASEV